MGGKRRDVLETRGVAMNMCDWCAKRKAVGSKRMRGVVMNVCGQCRKEKT
jgi:hypothetical protein